MKMGVFTQILLIAGLVFNISCSDSSDSKDKNNSGITPHETAKDTTDLRVCDGPMPVVLNVFQSWRSESQTSQGIYFTSILTVEYNAIEIQVICRDQFNHASVTVRANASVNGNTIRTLSNDSDTKTVQVGDRKLNCSASIEANRQMNYSFQGPCLKLSFGNESQVLVPEMTLSRP